MRKRPAHLRNPCPERRIRGGRTNAPTSPHRGWRTAAAACAALFFAALACVPGAAQEEAAQTPTQGVLLIPVPEIANQAGSVKTFLREVEERTAPTSEIEEVANKLPLARERGADLAKESKASLADTPSHDTLSSLQNRWRTLQRDLEQLDRVLTRRAEELETIKVQLEELKELWERSRKEAQAANAPAAILGRAREVFSGIDKAMQAVERRRTLVLLLENGVSTELDQCKAMIERIGKGSRQVVGRLFARNQPALWSAERRSVLLSDLPARVGRTARSNLGELYHYMEAHRDRILPHVLLSLLVLALLIRARAMLPHLKQEPETQDTAAVLGLPFSCAFFLSALMSLWIFPDPPAIFRYAIGLIYFIPLLRILHRLIERPLRLPLYGIIVASFVDRLRRFVADEPLSQWWFVLETLAACVFILWLERTGRLETQIWKRPLRRLARPVLLALFLAVLVGASGYMELAQFVCISVLGLGLLAVGLYAAVDVLASLFAYLLRAWPLNLSRLVRRNRSDLQKRCLTVLRASAVVCWIFGSLVITGLWDAAIYALSLIFNATVELGALHISLASVIIFAATVWVTFRVSAFVEFILEEDVYPRFKLARGVPYAVSRMTHYTILLLGFFVALATIGFDLTRFTIIAGAFGVGIGFGLQNVVNNFVSGLILLFERPVQVGDAVQIGDLFGEIRRIGLRSSTIRAWEGAEVIVPNANLISDAVTNWTLSDRMRRIDLPVGVAYGSNPTEVQALLERIAKEHELIVSDPEPKVLFTGFGESSLDFQLRAWTSEFDKWVQIRSDLAVAIYSALGEAGITIPFPQRDVHFMPAQPMDVRVVGETRGRSTDENPEKETSPAQEANREKKERDETPGA